MFFGKKSNPALVITLLRQNEIQVSPHADTTFHIFFQMGFKLLAIGNQANSYQKKAGCEMRSSVSESRSR